MRFEILTPPYLDIVIYCFQQLPWQRIQTVRKLFLGKPQEYFIRPDRLLAEISNYIMDIFYSCGIGSQRDDNLWRHAQIPGALCDEIAVGFDR